MAEVCTPPARIETADGSVLEAFGDEHSLADIARWIMRNRSDAEEMHRLLGEMLEEPKLYFDGDGDVTLDPKGEDLDKLVALASTRDQKVKHPEIIAEMVRRFNEWPDLLRECDRYRARKDEAYEERNRLVALLATMYPSGVKKTDIPGWDPEWHNAVFIDFPWGQASWHFHDSQAHLFEGFDTYDKLYDGHSTEMKYKNIETVTRRNLINRRG